jgi:antitoxin MazE
MTTTVQKWGNSLGIRIPKAIIEAIGAREGRELRITTQQHKMVIELVQTETIDIEKLIKKITLQNAHAEIQWGAAVGDEVW